MRNLALFQSVCTRHYVNRIDEIFGRDTRLFLILAKAEEAEAGNDDDGWIGIPQLGRIGVGPRVVIFLVCGSIFDCLSKHARLQSANIFLGGVPRKEERAYPGSQEMIRTTSA